jgi:hypothetical protein
MKKLINNSMLKLAMCAGIFCNMSFAMDKTNDQAKRLKGRGPQKQKGIYEKDNFNPKQLSDDKDLGCRDCGMCCAVGVVYIAAMVCSIDARASYYEQLGNK